MKTIFMSWIICCFFSSIAVANHNYYLFEQANKAYEQGNYPAAISQYEEILGNGYESWELYYNLGNAYYKNKQMGKAILNYERAKQLAHDNEDVIFNLELANLSVVDKIVVPPEFFLFQSFSDFKKFFSLNVLSILVVVVYLFTVMFVIFRIVFKKRSLQRMASLIIVPLIIILIVFTTTLIIRIYEHKNLQFGVILIHKVNVMSSPDDQGTEMFSLHEGVKVQVQKQLGDWQQIRLSDGKVGWLRKDALEII